MRNRICLGTGRIAFESPGFLSVRNPSEIVPPVSTRPVSPGGSPVYGVVGLGACPVSLSPFRQLGGLLPVERLDVGFVCRAVVEPVRLPDGLHQPEHLAD